MPNAYGGYNYSDQPGWQNGGAGGGGQYSNPGNGAAGFLGIAGNPQPAYFGGSPTGANAATQYMQAQAGRALGVAAPQADYGAANAVGSNLNVPGLNNYAQWNQGRQQMSLDLLGQAAQGKGPSAAQSQLQAGTNAAMQNNLAMAASSRGQAGLANAQHQALVQNGIQGQQAANQAAQLRAQEMQAAQAQYGQLATQGALGAGQQAIAGTLGEQGLLSGQATNQAQLQAQQHALGEQTALGYQGLGMQAQQGALQAQIANEQTSAGVNAANAAAQSNLLGTALGVAGTVGGAMIGGPIGAAAGGAAGKAVAGAAENSGGTSYAGPDENNSGTFYADAKLQEPGGKAAWTLREEKDFILARNDRTGEVRKVMTAPLSESEKHQAGAPHGADNMFGKVYGDMPMGPQAPQAGMALGAPQGPMMGAPSMAQRLDGASSIGRLYPRPGGV